MPKSLSKIKTQQLPAFTDEDYEYVFSQLLEGVAHGWQAKRILKFLGQLADRTTMSDWLVWLESYENKLMEDKGGNYTTAARMVRLGEIGKFVPQLQKMAAKAHDLGEKWLNRRAGVAVWEYEGSDAELPEVAVESNTEQNLDSSSSAANNELQTVTLEELQTMLQQNPDLVQQVAQQLGVETQEPEVIIQALIEQSQSSQIPTNNFSTVQEWFNFGLQQANAGDLVGAIASWDQALAIDSNVASAWHNRGSALGHLGRYSEAAASFAQATHLNPTDPQAWNDQGNALYNLQEWEKAIACWDEVLNLDPNNYQAWYNRGCALEQLGKYLAAIESYEKAAEINPEFTLARERSHELKAANNLE